MEIKVLSSTDKTSKFGKPYKSLEVFADNENRKVNVFSNAPDFANIKQGYTINGTMSKKGDYWDISFEGENSAPRASGGFKTAQIKEAMTVKREDITKFQDNKEYSIKLASTIRMAVDIATSLTTDQWHGTTMQEEIRWWREWLWTEWEDIDIKNTNPF